ncbi:hypothetical protein K439DRAFT_1406853 [Ramaria rubella]|nr:hypothetical protein K439DRAFT_1406853 [Ramaria rubella]
MQDRPSLNLHTPVSPITTYIKKPRHLQHVLQSNGLHAPECNSLQYSSQPDSLVKLPSYFLSIPGESLTHITTYIDDPSSLLALSRVNRRLRDHIADDNTWYRVFASYFWNIGPESDPPDATRLTLRRSENTWKKEFVARFRALRRWEKSRSSTLRYQPHYWNVSGMHLLDNVSLMTSNLQYGIVTRSFPLTGKILKGYLDASGTSNGFGIGNPNEEFSPNVSCTALSSCGGTGRIAWGFRNGEVASTSAPRVMDSNRSAARFTRSRMEDEHAGDVRCVLFAGRDDELVVSGCAQGQVKLWDARRMRCLWTGTNRKEDAVFPDPCVKAEYCVLANTFVATYERGDILLWWAFQLQGDGLGGQMLVGSPRSLRIPSISVDGASIDALHVDPNSSPTSVKVLVHHSNQSHVVRLVIDPLSGVVVSTRFCDGPLGPLTSFKPCFMARGSSSSPMPLTPVVTDVPSPSISPAANPTTSKEFSFIMAGDSLGRVSVWHWDTEGSSTTNNAVGSVPSSHAETQLQASRKWEAHDDGSVCAIEMNNTVIVTGSSCGTLKVWDCLTFSPLRSFASPASKPNSTGLWDPVGQIILRGDLLVASVGSRILVWQAGTVVSDKKGKSKHSGKPKGRGTASTLNKWQQQIELSRDIRESRRLLDDERAHAQRVHGRTRAQQSTLNQLGLSESEAVEYLLMLSQEEEDQRRTMELMNQPSIITRTVETTSDDTEAIFTLDEYSEFTRSQSVIDGLDPPSSLPSSRSSSFAGSLSLPRSMSFISNSQIQTSPFLPEAPEDELSVSLPAVADASQSTSPVPLGTRGNVRASTSISSTPISSLDDPDGFPVIGSPSGTPSRPTRSRSALSLQLSGSWSRGSPSSSLRSGGRGSAGDPSAGDLSSPSSSTFELEQNSTWRQYSPRESTQTRRQEEDEDEELKFVLDLSLAEAKSRDGL